MVEQVENLKERYELLEKRKKKEAEGYQADVQLLQQKIKKIESQLVSASIAKSKGKVFHCPESSFLRYHFRFAFFISPAEKKLTPVPLPENLRSLLPGVAMLFLVH